MDPSEQLKGAIRNLSKSRGIPAQEVLNIYLFERIIERLSKSAYREKFVLKGGLLIASIVGIAERTTLDMDATVKGLQMNEVEVSSVIDDILNLPVDDGITFRRIDIRPIRDEDDYNDFRVTVEAGFGKIRTPVKIDLTTGDAITPGAIQYHYSFLFEDKTVTILAYPIETILAEKYETIVRRNLQTTRARDFYDLFVLFRLYQEKADWRILQQATAATAERRGSMAQLQDAHRIITALGESESLLDLWNRYRARFSFAAKIEYSECVQTIRQYHRMISFSP